MPLLTCHIFDCHFHHRKSRSTQSSNFPLLFPIHSPSKVASSASVLRRMYFANKHSPPPYFDSKSQVNILHCNPVGTIIHPPHRLQSTLTPTSSPPSIPHMEATYTRHYQHYWNHYRCDEHDHLLEYGSFSRPSPPLNRPISRLSM